jgi:hypothetical protein
MVDGHGDTGNAGGQEGMTTILRDLQEEQEKYRAGLNAKQQRRTVGILCEVAVLALAIGIFVAFRTEISEWLNTTVAKALVSCFQKSGPTG